MEYINHNGLKLSCIGVGCYSLSGVYGRKDVEQIKKVINRAYQLGVNFFDTAEAYGNAEEILGDTIKTYRKNVIVSTKVGVRENTKPNLSYDYIKSACVNSLKRLNTEYIDIYNVHFNDPDTPVEETIAALRDLIREGKIRKYGLGHLPKERVIEYLKKGEVYSILMELSTVSRKSAEELLPLCREHNVGGIAFSITGRGLLTGKYNKHSTFEKSDIRNLDPQFQHERLEYSLEIMKKLKEIGNRHNMSSVQMAIAWVLSQKGVISGLTGPSTIEHLEENIAGSKLKLDDRESKEIEEFIQEKDRWLKKEEVKTIKNILNNDLVEDREKAFVDLVYCIEVSISNGYVKEQEIMPVYFKLFEMKKQLNKIKILDLESIKKEVKKLINPSLRPLF